MNPDTAGYPDRRLLADIGCREYIAHIPHIFGTVMDAD